MRKDFAGYTVLGKKCVLDVTVCDLIMSLRWPSKGTFNAMKAKEGQGVERK